MWRSSGRANVTSGAGAPACATFATHTVVNVARAAGPGVVVTLCSQREHDVERPRIARADVTLGGGPHVTLWGT